MFIFDAIIISDLEQKVNVIGLIFHCLYQSADQLLLGSTQILLEW